MAFSAYLPESSCRQFCGFSRLLAKNNSTTRHSQVVHDVQILNWSTCCKLKNDSKSKFWQEMTHAVIVMQACKWYSGTIGIEHDESNETKPQRYQRTDIAKNKYFQKQCRQCCTQITQIPCIWCHAWHHMITWILSTNYRNWLHNWEWLKTLDILVVPHLFFVLLRWTLSTILATMVYMAYTLYLQF